jgi:hypothetical protein
MMMLLAYRDYSSSHPAIAAAPAEHARGIAACARTGIGGTAASSAAVGQLDCFGG